VLLVAVAVALLTAEVVALPMVVAVAGILIANP